MPFDPDFYPYDSIVYITDTINGQGWQGSGVLISPDEVLTASHVVYNSINGTASNIKVTPAYNAGSAPFGSATGTYLHYFQIQDSNDLISSQASQTDYAVIHLSQPFTGLGSMGLQANFAGGLANVTGYPAVAGGQMVSSQEAFTQDPHYTLLNGASIGPGSSGGPVWIIGSNGIPDVVGVVSSANGGVGSAGFFTQITTAAFTQIEAWVAQDDAPNGGGGGNAGVAVLDTTTGQPLTPATTPYAGPVGGLTNEYIDVTSDNLNISVSTPGWFIHSGSGDDAIAASSGTNVLDGGTGSNLLLGGSGTDTFFVDDRGAAVSIWSTIASFHMGDVATVWGVTPTNDTMAWVDAQGAVGFTGLTLHATAGSNPTASLTLAGYSRSDIESGRLSVTFGTDAASGSSYMTVRANG